MQKESFFSPNRLLPLIHKGIKYSFYSLFFFVPLIMWPDTSELFELNKMLFVWAVSLFIFFLWGVKIILTRRIEIRKTPLDIPIALFLLSQIISTIFSIDPYVSFWGYYSRFNGGLLSIATYIFLYYAFASNLFGKQDSEKEPPISYKVLLTSLLAGLVVTLWGLPSHFGYDPTCFLFRGTLDTSCWTENFKPTIRIFSTLGQPNWLATYLAALLPISIAFGIFFLNKKGENSKKSPLMQALKTPNVIFPSLFLGLVFLFYIALLFTRSQSGLLGFFLGIQVFMALLFIFTRDLHNFSIPFLLKTKIVRFLIGLNLIFFLITFFIGTPNKTFDKYLTYNGLKETFFAEKSTDKNVATQTQNISDTGGTDSSKIRLIVWQGAIKIFLNNPIIGTGAETFAFAYYKQKPVAHNLTSEWNFLYNKAHNEYLNYLATTGIFGLGTYLAIIIVFLVKALKDMFVKRKRGNYFVISMALLGSYVAILVSNFFGFSVVIVNLYLFLIPLFFYELEHPAAIKFSYTKSFAGGIDDASRSKSKNSLIIIVVLSLIILYLGYSLLRFWLADRQYGLGHNLNLVQEYTRSYIPLVNAVTMRPGEDLYKNDLAINLSALSYIFYTQDETTQSAQFAEQAKLLSREIANRHPKNIVYLKGQARVGYFLSQSDPEEIDIAINALEKAQVLAPTDPEIQYNLALFYKEKGEIAKSIEHLDRAIKLKSNYITAYYTRALYYNELSKEDFQRILEYQNKAKEDLLYILEIDPENKAAQELLNSIQN